MLKTPLQTEETSTVKSVEGYKHTHTHTHKHTHPGNKLIFYLQKKSSYLKKKTQIIYKI